MRGSQDNADQRRARRKRPGTSAVVTDVITSQPIGHLGNLSSTGMLLIGTRQPRSEALYQVSITLPSSGLGLRESQPIEAGIQEQWHAPAATPGQIWAGYRVVAISDVDAARLEGWLAQA